MSVFVFVADAATQYWAVDLPLNCTLVNPIKDAVLSFAGAIATLIRWIAAIIFVLAVVALFIPSDKVRRIVLITLGVILVVALFGTGINQVGQTAIGASC